MYNLTNITAAENPAAMAAAVNDGVGGILFGGFTIALYFILLFSLRRGGWEIVDTILSASLTVFVVSGVLSAGGFVDILYPLAYLILTGFSAMWLYLTRR